MSLSEGASPLPPDAPIPGELPERSGSAGALRATGGAGLTTDDRGASRVPQDVPSARGAGAISGLSVVVFVLLALTLAPLAIPPFFLQLLTEIAIVGLFATAFNLLMGFGGMVSFGHAAYFALGAYTAALLVNQTMRADLGKG